MLLRARGLSKTFTGPGGTPVPVLHGIDLEVKGGELVAVSGVSGSGKSTLLNLIGLLEPPDAGEIWLGDERVSHVGRRAQCRVRGASIGYVFQSFLLLAGLTALDNVMLAARYVGRDRADARREALGRRAAARRLLSRRAEPSTARARRRADGQPRRRACPGHPGRAPRAGRRPRHGRDARHAPDGGP